jgi:hypothetical protein
MFILQHSGIFKVFNFKLRECTSPDRKSLYLIQSRLPQKVVFWQVEKFFRDSKIMGIASHLYE